MARKKQENKLFGLFKKDGRKWVREYENMSFRQEKAERFFKSSVEELKNFDGHERAVREIKPVVSSET